MWCGGGHPHKEYPGRGNAASIPTCCNWKLVNEEEPHPSNYRGCRHAKEEKQKRKSQRAPKSTRERAFSFNHTTPVLSFAAALRSNTEQNQEPQPPLVTQAYPTTVVEICAPLPLRYNKQVPSQSVQAPNVNSLSPNNIFKVVATVYQQIIT
jgi:hypothetical protein